MSMRPYFGEFAMGASRRNQAEGIGKAEPDLGRTHEIARLRGLVADWEAYGEWATARIAELEAEVVDLKRRIAERDARDGRSDGVTVKRDAAGPTGDAAKLKAAERARRYRERRKQSAHQLSPV